jgi:C_GCAxxG_C_C family probable redox protein
VTTGKAEQAKAQALAGYMDPGPGHLNCAQAVMRFGLLMMDQDPALIRIGSYLGGGMARMGQVCGALSGAAVTLGVREQLDIPGRPKSSETFEALQKLVRNFESQFGAVTCRDLLGCDISTPEGFRQAKRARATSRCPEFVAWCCDRLAEMLERRSDETLAG